MKEIKKSSQNKPPIFVYNLGKVASTTIYASIKEQLKDFHCEHTHFFNFINYLMMSPRIKIISPIREPISRNISGFLNNRYTPVDESDEYYKNTKSINGLLKIFLNNFDHDVPLSFFDKNLKKYLGIDVYKVPFPKEGYITMNKGKVDLLLFRFDLNDKLKEELISKFLGVKHFKLTRHNVSDDKPYGDIYKRFKQLSMPDEYIDAMLKSKYVQHFFYDDVKAIRKRWQKPKN